MHILKIIDTPGTKRVLETLASAAGLLLLSPVLLILMGFVRLDTPGSALFAQRRVGRYQMPFVCYKLRTMAEDAGDLPTHEMGVAKITKVGRILRATKLDELPQLYNVVRGEMSLVGPRPCLEMQTALIKARADQNVFSVLPGITGPAQLQGVDMSTPERLAEVDGAYVKNRSLKGDLALIFRTVFRDPRASGNARGPRAKPD